jgi:hypothetical protein
MALWFKVLASVRGINAVLQATLSWYLLPRFPNFILWRALIRKYGMAQAIRISSWCGLLLATACTVSIMLWWEAF